MASKTLVPFQYWLKRENSSSYVIELYKDFDELAEANGLYDDTPDSSTRDTNNGSDSNID